jgi:hypothetical protein
MNEHHITSAAAGCVGGGVTCHSGYVTEQAMGHFPEFWKRPGLLASRWHNDHVDTCAA